ncbi:MAG: rRNA pseudouridine synthase [Acidobacteria bacterium]|nr:rRNA pseudouridine synthase [Acidobacteriota bacterium]
MDQRERLQKIISSAGVASRRKAELLILQGRVTVNGSTVTQLGTRADPSEDFIRVDGKRVEISPRKIYILLNKPRQVISSVSDPQGRRKVTDLVKAKEKIFPVGRLDYNTEGLILLTNDGDFSHAVARAGRRMPKVYHVKVRSRPEELKLNRLRKGIRLKSGIQLAPCRITDLGGDRNGWYEVTLTQGKNRQIREMFEAVGSPVQKLRRIKIGFLTGKDLPVGHCRHLTPGEVAQVFRVTKDRTPVSEKRPGPKG